ncbi:sodium-dependent transporter [Litorimonas haliclonae]|uniref:sodium-dependent transporter n=1 Tax=Litorimonas haliclonae TaxID=2081977 RepID=UPI0039F05288
MASIAAPGKAQWSSRFAFIMAAVGSSVGLGNLWRFSSEAGTNGGGAFILIYLLAVLFVCIPVLMSEYMVGRSGNVANAVGSVDDVAQRSGRSRNWRGAAWVGMLAGFFIVTFYCVIAGWVLRYIFFFLSNGFSGMAPDDVAARFVEFISNPIAVLPWFLAFALITIWLVSRGVNKGIEWAATMLMPAFFVLLACLAVFALVTNLSDGGTAAALEFLYVPDWNEMMTKNPEISAVSNIGSVANAALGQAFFSVSVGSAIMITYGSYIPNDVSLPKAATTVAIMDSMVALIAGLAIFPIVFGSGLSESAGPALLFITLPNAFEAMGIIGPVVGAAFFFLAFFAAITSSVSLLEPSAAYASEKFNMSKSKAAWVVGGLMIAIGLFSVFGVGEGGATPSLDAIDGFTSKVMLPLAGFLIIIFVGWRMDSRLVHEQIKGEGEKLGKVIFFFCRWVAPIFVGAVMVTSIMSYIRSFTG